MSAAPCCCDTDQVNRFEEMVRGAWPALRRRTGTLQPPSRWAWVADIALALTMLAGTLNSGYHHGDNPVDHGPFYGVNHLITVSGRDTFWTVMTALPLATRRRY